MRAADPFYRERVADFWVGYPTFYCSNRINRSQQIAEIYTFFIGARPRMV